MTTLFRRLRHVDGKECWEPTSLAIAFVLAGCLLAVALCLAGMMLWPMLGQGWWLLGKVAVLLACLLAVRRWGHSHAQPAATWRQAILSHVLGAGWKWTMVLLACWLGLAAWSELPARGAVPAPKADARLIRVLTWNIHCGQDGGPPWQRFDWPGRKHALQAAVNQAAPDILCVQEAQPGQVSFLEKALPGHHRVGVGRDDGGSGGEHCAIYFDARRFDELDSGTFWLQEPTAPLATNAPLPRSPCATAAALLDVP